MSSALEEGSFSPKDYKANYIKLIASDGKELDILGLVAELKLHQSIDSSVMFGSVVIVDGQGILANFSVSGSDLISISIDQPSLSNPIERTFRLFKITERTHNGNAGAKYIMHFISDEMITSSAFSISKAYKNKTVSNIVSDLLANTLKTKRIERIEETTGLHNYIIPDMRVFEAIQWLASRAYNANPSYAYHFFETRDGFNFVSLQSMYKSPPVRKLKYDIKNTNEEPNSSSDVGKNRDSIESFRIMYDFDLLKSLAEGSYASNLLDINLMNQSFTTYEFSLYVAEGQKLLLNQYKTINEDFLLDTTTSLNRVMVSTNTTGDEKANEIDKWVMPNKMHRSLINAYKVKISIAGDVTLKPGSVIELEMPKFVAADEEAKENDLFRSGKYLITSISHIFRNSGTMDSVIELASDSYSNALPSAKDLSKLSRG